MLGIHDLWLFIVSGLVLNILPGPDSLYVITRSATQGWRAGWVAGLGIGAGCCFHVLAAALGLSALLAASAAAFTVVKLVGAAYLVWLGVGMLRSRASPESADEGASHRPAALATIFRQGLLTNVLNPKVALFFLAFVPQFIAQDAASKPLAFLVLGAVFDVNGILWLFVLASATAFARRRLRPSALFARWLTRGVGALFLALGLRLALSTR